MSDQDDDDEGASPAQAFAGLQEHVDGYKSYLGKLKKGTSSGISSVFGLAKELLPEEHLKEYVYGGKRFDLDQTILKDGSPPGILRQALEQTITAFHSKPNQSTAAVSDGERTVLGEILEDGKRFFVYSDLSIEEAIFQNVQAEPEVEEIGDDVDPIVEALGDELAASFNVLEAIENQQSSPPTYDSREDDSTELSEGEGAHGSAGGQGSVELEESESVHGAESLPLPVFENQASKPAARVEPERMASPPVVLEQFAPVKVPAEGLRREVDLSVASPNGEWLWDVILSDEQVAEVLFADGTCIMRSSDPARYVLVPAVSPGRKAREAQIVAVVLCDPVTGNLFFRTESGDQAVALLNNGFRIDQFSSANGEDRFFVTEPLKPGQLIRNSFQVRDLNLDPLKLSVSYETIDGGMYVTARFRKL
jgi:hypothetical protein